MFGPCCVIRLCSPVLVYGGWESRGGENPDGGAPHICTGVVAAAAAIYWSTGAWFGKLLNASGVAEQAGRCLQPGFISTSASNSPVLVYGAGFEVVFFVYGHACASCCLTPLSLYRRVCMAATCTPFLASMPGGRRWTQPQIRCAGVNLRFAGSWCSSSSVSCFEKREKKQPCLICCCNSSWSGMDSNQVFMRLYSPIPTVCTQSYKKEKRRHFKIQFGFKKACLNCKKYWTSARDFGIWVKIEIPLQDLLYYWAITSIPS